MRELNEMQILAGASQRALANMTAANQRLQSQVHTLQERLDAVVDAALAKDAEIGALAGKLAAAQAVVDAARDANDVLDQLLRYSGIKLSDVAESNTIAAHTALTSALAAYDSALEPEAKP